MEVDAGDERRRAPKWTVVLEVDTEPTETTDPTDPTDPLTPDELDNAFNNVNLDVAIVGAGPISIDGSQACAGSWSEFTDCTVECGGGTKTPTFTVAMGDCTDPSDGEVERIVI